MEGVWIRCGECIRQSMERDEDSLKISPIWDPTMWVMLRLSPSEAASSEEK